MRGFLTYKKETDMKKFIVIILILLSNLIYSQQILTDADFEQAVEGRSAFQDDNISIVVVEFWASFNDDNSFEHWNKVKGVKYYRCDIAKASKAKKKYKVRTIPHIIIFKDGFDEVHFKAGLDFKISESLEDIQKEINELLNESKF
jgi:thiol-disulfide isomerase/thioredoxin